MTFDEAFAWLQKNMKGEWAWAMDRHKSRAVWCGRPGLDSIEILRLSSHGRITVLPASTAWDEFKTFEEATQAIWNRFEYLRKDPLELLGELNEP